MANYTSTSPFNNDDLWIANTSMSTNERFGGTVTDTGFQPTGLTTGTRTITYTELDFESGGLTYRYIGNWTIKGSVGLVNSRLEVSGTYTSVIVQEPDGDRVAEFTGEPRPVQLIDQGGLTLVVLVGSLLTTVTNILFGPSASNDAYANLHTDATVNLPELAFNGNDVLQGSSGNDVIHGYSGNDTIISGGGADFLYGGQGNDNYYVISAAQQAIDETDGGYDTVHVYGASYSLADNGVNLEALIIESGSDLSGGGNAADNYIASFGDRSTLNGGDGNDVLEMYGIGGSLNGEAGNDVLQAHSTDTILRGGIGNDVYTLSSSTIIVQEDAGAPAGYDTVYAYNTSFSLLTNGQNVEALILQTGNGFMGVGNNLDNLMASLGSGATLDGGAGNDSLEAYGVNSTLMGGSGNDFLVSHAANTILIGGIGNDSFFVDSADDVVFDESGDAGGYDIIYSNGVSYTIGTGSNVEGLILQSGNGLTALGNNENNFLATIGNNSSVYGGNGNDTIEGYGSGSVLNGESGDDFIVARADNLTLVGGSGNDTFVVSSSLVSILESTEVSGGFDVVQASNTNFSISQTIGVEGIILQQGNNFTATGNSSANYLASIGSFSTLEGAAGNDTLDVYGSSSVANGGEGNDFIILRSDNGRASGGSGNDVFDLHLSSGVNTVSDFNSNADVFVFSSSQFSTYDAFIASAHQQGEDIFVTAANGSSFIFEDVQLSSLFANNVSVI